MFNAALYKIVGSCALILSSLGLIANIIIFYIIKTHKRFHSMTYKIILTSVLSDILTVLSMIVAGVNLVTDSISYSAGLILCRSTLFLTLASYGVSMMNLCLIGTERYFNIVRFSSDFFHRHRKIILLGSEITIWLVVVSINSPLFSMIYVYKNDTILCDIPVIMIGESIYLLSLSFTLYIIPCILLTIIYSKIINHQKHYNRPGNLSSLQIITQQKKKKKFIKLLVLITLSYIFSTWPAFATFIGMAISQTSLKQIQEKNVAIFLISLISVTITTGIALLNPLIYLKFDTNIREIFILTVRKLLLMKNPSNVVHVLSSTTEKLSRSKSFECR